MLYFRDVDPVLRQRAEQQVGTISFPGLVARAVKGLEQLGPVTPKESRVACPSAW